MWFCLHSARYITFLSLFTPLYCFLLLLQVCEERLQFSLSENVKTNVLWGATVKDTVMIRPWGEQITDTSSELVTVKEQKEDERYEELGNLILNNISEFLSVDSPRSQKKLFFTYLLWYLKEPSKSFFAK